MTISDFGNQYLDSIKLARSENTARAYSNGLDLFFVVLKERWIDPKTALINEMKEETISWFAAYLKIYSPATERLYLQSVKGFFEYLAAENAYDINLPRIRLLIRQRSRRSGIRLPQFPRESIEKILIYIEEYPTQIYNDPTEKLRALRDRE
jgi:integrase/recombinase XerC